MVVLGQTCWANMWPQMQPKRPVDNALVAWLALKLTLLVGFRALMPHRRNVAAPSPDRIAIDHGLGRCWQRQDERREDRCRRFHRENLTREPNTMLALFGFCV
jgi:hypothetical protein